MRKIEINLSIKVVVESESENSEKERESVCVCVFVRVLKEHTESESVDLRGSEQCGRLGKNIWLQGFGGVA